MLDENLDWAWTVHQVYSEPEGLFTFKKIIWSQNPKLRRPAIFLNVKNKKVHKKVNFKRNTKIFYWKPLSTCFAAKKPLQSQYFQLDVFWLFCQAILFWATQPLQIRIFWLLPVNKMCLLKDVIILNLLEIT